MPNIKVKSGDGDIFFVDVKVARKCTTINTMLDDLGFDDNEGDDDDADPIPLPTVSTAVLKRVIDWATYHKDDPEPVEGDKSKNNTLSQWDTDFLRIDYFELTELTKAANYLDIKGLLDCCTTTIANMIRGKTPEEIRRILHIRNDFQDHRH